MGFPAALLAWAIGGVARALYGVSQVGLLLLVIL
jgi:hypothetical protein